MFQAKLNIIELKFYSKCIKKLSCDINTVAGVKEILKGAIAKRLNINWTIVKKVKYSSEKNLSMNNYVCWSLLIVF